MDKYTRMTIDRNAARYAVIVSGFGWEFVAGHSDMMGFATAIAVKARLLYGPLIKVGQATVSIYDNHSGGMTDERPEDRDSTDACDLSPSGLDAARGPSEE